MPINFNKLQLLLKEKNIKEYSVRKYSGVGGATLDKVFGRTEGHVDTRSIEKLCKYLNCQPADIMEYVENKIER